MKKNMGTVDRQYVAAAPGSQCAAKNCAVACAPSTS